MQQVGPVVPVNVPWGVAIDGKDNVWVGNLLGAGMFYLCGTDPNECPQGMKTDDIMWAM